MSDRSLGATDRPPPIGTIRVAMLLLAQIFCGTQVITGAQPGRFPRDVDLIVVGEIDEFDLAGLLRPAAKTLGVGIRSCIDQISGTPTSRCFSRVSR